MMLLPLAANADESGACGDSLTWKYEEATKTLTISGSGSMTDYSFYGSLVAPWYQYAANIATLNLESGITKIGSYAFRDFSSLTTIEIPSSVTVIGASSFSRCSALTNVTIPNSVITIEGYAFANCI